MASSNSPSMEKKKGGKRTKQAMVKGAWSKDEDDVVTRLVVQYGPKRWSLIASNLPGDSSISIHQSCHVCQVIHQSLASMYMAACSCGLL